MTVAATVAVIWIAGCAVGPNFKTPAAPGVAGYTADPLRAHGGATGVTGGRTQVFASAVDIPGDWWTVFRSRPLNDLIERSLQNNPSLAAAQAALRGAREATLAQVGSYFPSVGLNFAAVRQRSSVNIAPVPSSNALMFNLYTPQVSVSYAPDVFGLNRRSVESLNAQAEAQRFALAATQITLASNVVEAAVQEASLRGQVDATRQLIEINTRMVDILRKQRTAGYASGLDVAAQESQLAQAAAALPPLQKQLDQVRDLLAALSGGLPGEGGIPAFDLDGLALPRELPVTLPSQLVRQRPDVRQAEEAMHAACAQVGIAVANRFPSFLLTGNAGSAALQIGQLAANGAGFWTIGAAAAQPIFEGGALLHKERAARAAYEQASEQYRSTVIGAFQNVADVLSALEHDGEGLRAAADAERAAKVTLDLTSRQVKSGYANSLALLSAEQVYQQALINLVQAEANRYSDTAALFQALGGGWWHRAELAGS